MDSFWIMSIIGLTIGVAILIYQNRKLINNNKLLTEDNGKLEYIRNKYKDVIDLEDAKEKLKSESEAILSQIDSNKERALKALNIKEELEKDISLLEEDLTLQEFSFYKPKYHFEDIEEYKEALDENRTKQKELIKSKVAVVCHANWQVEGSKAKGKALTNNIIKLGLRAFNGECDAAIAKVKYNNVNVMEKRIEKSYEMINKMISHFSCEIQSEYLKLKLSELYLTHEHHEKVQEEREEQKRIKEQIRDEERAQKEYEKAQREALKEEARAQNALEKARRELESAHGEKVNKLKEKLLLLEQQLEDAKSLKERATSMAQLTKSGHVYVISNIGSFGENVYKVGMTRRLEPLDRVRELGNASVPFNYDVHAMIYTDNAPELENKLHKELEEKRINKVNKRREFFKATLEEIKNLVEKNHGTIKLTKLAEAREYRETLAIIREQEALKVRSKDDAKEGILSI